MHDASGPNISTFIVNCKGKGIALSPAGRLNDLEGRLKKVNDVQASFGKRHLERFLF